MKQYKFNAILRKVEGINGAYIEFPYDVQTEFGVKGRVPVSATFDGVPYRGSLVKMGTECHILGVTGEIRRKIGKEPGDTVTVILSKDETERTVEIPPDFAAALSEAGLTSAFNEMSFSHRREHVQAILDAKKPETRTKRIISAMEMIRKGLKRK